MTYFRFLFILNCLMLVLPCALPAQSWDFIKEKEGIKLYTRQEAGKTNKAFRGVTVINAPAEKIFDLLDDINNTDWWDKNLTLVNVLHYEKHKAARYYVVYDLPWPLIDRDLCVDVTVTYGKANAESRISVVSVNGVVPEKNNMVRIKDYRETWIVKSAGEGMANVVFEGIIDPAGKIPDWISNMLIVDSPFKSITGLRDRVVGE